MTPVSKALAVLSLSVGLAACAHAPSGPAISLRVETNVPDATVWIDDVLVGRAAEWTANGQQVRHIRAGFHRVEIRAPGYYSVYKELDGVDGSVAIVKAELRPLLD